MKRILIAATAIVMLTGPASAVFTPRQMSETPPKISAGTDSTKAILQMRKAGFAADPGRCLKAHPNVCEMDFVNVCGVVHRIVFQGQKVAAITFLTWMVPEKKDKRCQAKWDSKETPDYEDE